MLNLSDDELIENTHAGSIAAFEELWQRHSAFGIIAATGQDKEYAQEINNEAWAEILHEIRAGDHPDTAFRPYLYFHIQQIASGLGQNSDEPSTRMGEAFSSLPVRWQEVLWYLDVEHMNPDDVTFLTNLPADSIATTQQRARRGLSAAWLQTNASHAPQDSECHWVRERARAYLKKTLPQTDVDRVEQHLASCQDCRNIVATGRSMGSQAPKLLLTAMAGPASAAALNVYLKSDGPIVINEDPLPEVIVDDFTSPVEPRFTGIGPTGGSGETAAAVAGGLGLGAAAGLAVGAASLAASSAGGVGLANLSGLSASDTDESTISGSADTAPSDTTTGSASSLTPEMRSPQTYANQEHARRRRGAFWIGGLVLLALIALIVAVAVITSLDNSPSPNPPTPALTQTRHPSVSPSLTQSQTPTPSPTPTPSDTVPSDTVSASTTPTDAATTEPTQNEVVNVPPAKTSNPVVQPPPQTTTQPPRATVSIGSIDIGDLGVLYPVISGAANPGDTVLVQINGSNYSTTADARGNWVLDNSFTNLTPGLQTVTVRTAVNPITVASSFTLASPPQITISGDSPVVVSLTGIPHANVQLIIDQSTSQVVALDYQGVYSGNLDLGDGQHSITARYVNSGRFGPMTSPIDI